MFMHKARLINNQYVCNNISHLPEQRNSNFFFYFYHGLCRYKIIITPVVSVWNPVNLVARSVRVHSNYRQ